MQVDPSVQVWPLTVVAGLASAELGIADRLIAPVDAIATPPDAESPALPTCPMGNWPVTPVELEFARLAAT